MEPLTDVFGTQTSAAAMAFGLRGVVDWSVQQPFLDVFKTARPWHAHSENQWGLYLADDLAGMGVLDENGWVRELPPGIAQIQTFILTEMPAEATYTAGLYRLTFDGAGDITVNGAEIVSRGNGEIWFNHQPTGDGMVVISINATDPQNTGNYIRNIEVVKQEHIPAHEAGQMFNPLWLDLIGDTHSLRFMDWQETNDSTLQSWSDRPQVGHYTYHGGVPLEVIIELANTTGTEPWINIPWDADENFIREFATYVRDNLNPDLRAHIELSNEVWNWMFDQAQDAAVAARARFGQDLGDGWVQEYGVRSAEMARILDQVYAGAEDQLVKVISTHTYWPGLENAIFDAPAWQAQNSANPAPYELFDTYAITGYFGNSLGTDEKANAVLGWISRSEAQARQDAAAQGLTGSAAATYFAEHRFDLAVDLAVRELRDGSVTGNAEDSLQGLFELFRYHKAAADAHGLDLVMYEGGTHVVGVGAWVENELLTEFFNHLNYSDGMGQLYSELLAGWEAAGGTLFNAFVEVSEPNQWGSWGSLRHLEDSTPRHDAVVRFMDSHPAPAHMKDGTWASAPMDFGVPPGPTPDPEPQTDRDPVQRPDPTETPDPTSPPNQPNTPGPTVNRDPIPRPDRDPQPRPAETDEVREYVFGNDMFVWAVGDPELSVAHWVNVIAESAGQSYSVAMQTGMLNQHASVPPSPHIALPTVTEAWDPDLGGDFASAGFNQITISAANFVQDQAPDAPYWIDPSTSPAQSALRIIDWATSQAPGAAINIYETWPEMEGFISTFPPSAAQFAAWEAYMVGEWHTWWVTLTDIVQSARPDLEVRLISVGPEIAALLDDPSVGLGGLQPSDLYLDDGPHGTPTLYFLSALIHYTTLFGRLPPSDLQLPDTIHPVVARNIDGIVSWIGEGLEMPLPDAIVDPFVEQSTGEPIAPSPVDARDSRDVSNPNGGSDQAPVGPSGGIDRVTVSPTGGSDPVPAGPTAGFDQTPGSPTSGNDRDPVTPTDGNDRTGFTPTDGDDRITQVPLDGMIDGRGGSDTVVLPGDQASYSVSISSDLIFVEDRSAATGTMSLRNIEWLDFDSEIAPFGSDGMSIDMLDGMASLDGASMAALTELYIAYFNRAPDAVGLFYWGDQMAGGMSMDQIARYFFDQPETRALYGDLDDMPGFVTAVYQNVLGRDPDAEGMAYWLDQLEREGPVTPPTFILDIIAGAKAETGGPADAAYLANKVILGGHFAVVRGMSDVSDAGLIMAGFDGSDASLQAGIAQSDAIHTGILDGSNEGFLLQLVGVTDTPFVF